MSKQIFGFALIITGAIILNSCGVMRINEAIVGEWKSKDHQITVRIKDDKTKFKFISERAIQIHGAIGTSREFDTGLFYRRAKSFEYVMGDTDYHYELVAKGLGL